MAVGDLRKIEVRAQHTRHWLWYITAISFVTGALLATSIRTQKEIFQSFAQNGVASYRVDALMERLKGTWEENKALRETIKQQNAKVTELENEISAGVPNTQRLNEDLQKYKVLLGLTDLKGPGVVLTLNDRKMDPNEHDPNAIEGGMLHDNDLQRVVNELRVAGAEAISINGQRMVERSAIRCVGSVVHVNNVPVAAPFTLTAVGDPQVLYSGMMIKGGVLDVLKWMGFPMTLEKQPLVRVPAYNGSVGMHFAVPVLPPAPAGETGEAKK